MILGLIKAYGSLKLPPLSGGLSNKLTFVPLHLLVFITNVNNFGTVRTYLTELNFDTKYDFPVFDLLGYADSQEIITVFVSLPAVILQIGYQFKTSIIPNKLGFATANAAIILNLYFISLYIWTMKYHVASKCGSVKSSAGKSIRLKLESPITMFIILELRLCLSYFVGDNAIKGSIDDTCIFEDNILQVHKRKCKCE